MMLPQGDRDCPVNKKCKELLEKYKGDELQIKLAEATADDWLVMYEYKPFTLDKPKVALDYVAMTALERSTFDKHNPDWADSEEMKAYANKENDSVRTLESNQVYLKSSLEYLKEDVPRREKILGVLAGYPNAKVRVVQPTANWHD